MKILSESCCCIPELPKTEGVQLILSISLQGVLCVSASKGLSYRLENFSSPQPEHVKSSPVWLKSVHKLVGRIEFTLKSIKSGDNSKNETLTLNLIFLLRLCIVKINYLITSCTP